MLEAKTDVFPNQELNAGNEIDIKEIWRIIRSYRKAIGLIFSGVLIITIYFTFTTRPVWQATTVVMIKEGGSDPFARIGKTKNATRRRQYARVPEKCVRCPSDHD